MSKNIRTFAKKFWAGFSKLHSTCPNERCRCHKHRLGQSSVFSDSEVLASGWWSLSELSSFVPSLVRSVFRDISWAVPEWPLIGGFKRKSFRRTSAPRMRLSVLLNSWDNFFFTLTSFSSETWVVVSSCDLGTFEFCAKLLLAFSSQFSLLRAASFRLFLKVAIFYGKSNEERLMLNYHFMNELNLFLHFQYLRKAKLYWMLSPVLSE